MKELGNLVLGRRVGEVVMVGDDIKVTVVNIHENQVWLMFNASKEIDIDRYEIYLRKKKEEKDNGK